MTVRTGQWKAPTLFLPVGVSSPVLPPIGRVHLADERRRHCHPGHAAQVGRRREAGDVRQRAAAESHHGSAAVEPKLAPQALEDVQRLRLSHRAAARAARRAAPRGRAVPRRREMPATCASATSATGPSPGTSCPSRSRAPVSTWMPAGREHDVIGVACDARPRPRRRAAAARRRVAETRPRPGERPVAAADPLPRGVHVDVEQHRARALARASPAPRRTSPRRRRARTLPAHPRRATSATTASSIVPEAASRASGRAPAIVVPMRSRSPRRGRWNAAPSAAATSLATVVLPAPMKPTSARWRPRTRGATGCARGTRGRRRASRRARRRRTSRARHGRAPRRQRPRRPRPAPRPRPRRCARRAPRAARRSRGRPSGAGA